MAGSSDEVKNASGDGNWRIANFLSQCEILMKVEDRGLATLCWFGSPLVRPLKYNWRM